MIKEGLAAGGEMDISTALGDVLKTALNRHGSAQGLSTCGSRPFGVQ